MLCYAVKIELAGLSQSELLSLVHFSFSSLLGLAITARAQVDCFDALDDCPLIPAAIRDVTVSECCEEEGRSYRTAGGQCCGCDDKGKNYIKRPKLIYVTKA